jgi:hypothetical protein
MGRLIRFLELTGTDRSLLVEATLWLGVARVVVLVLPFRWIAPYLGRPMALSPEEGESTAEDLLERVSWAVTTASRHLPWECKCLVQALAGKAMLRRRRVPSTIYLGLAKDGENMLQAHAWLRCGKKIMTGGQEAMAYKIVASFAEERK